MLSINNTVPFVHTFIVSQSALSISEECVNNDLFLI